MGTTTEIEDGKQKAGSTFITVPFPVELEKQARIEAAIQGISRAKLVRNAVVDYLQRLSKMKVTGNE